MIRSIFLIAIMVISSIGIAQMKSTNAQIFGEVQCDGKHIPFINVYVKGSTIGTTTDHRKKTRI